MATPLDQLLPKICFGDSRTHALSGDGVFAQDMALLRALNALQRVRSHSQLYFEIAFPIPWWCKTSSAVAANNNVTDSIDKPASRSVELSDSGDVEQSTAGRFGASALRITDGQYVLCRVLSCKYHCYSLSLNLAGLDHPPPTGIL